MGLYLAYVSLLELFISQGKRLLVGKMAQDSVEARYWAEFPTGLFTKPAYIVWSKNLGSSWSFCMRPGQVRAGSLPGAIGAGGGHRWAQNVSGREPGREPAALFGSELGR